MAFHHGRNARGRGGPRNAPRGSGKLARSGIRTKNGYKKFDSQRLKDNDSSSDERPPEVPEQEPELEESDSGEESDAATVPPANTSYNSLLESFRQIDEAGEPRAKRRRIESNRKPDLEPRDEQSLSGDVVNDEPEDEGDEDENDDESETLDNDVEASDDLDSDPYETHFASPDVSELAGCVKSIEAGSWKIEKQSLGKYGNTVASRPSSARRTTILRKPFQDVSHLSLKKRLMGTVAEGLKVGGDIEAAVTPYIFEYVDLLMGCRTIRNSTNLRQIACLHAVNHILKGRDRVLKNNERISLAGKSVEIEARDQGFVRPKVLLLLETRQMAAAYADSIVQSFRPDQQENKKRFDDSFRGPIADRDNMPDDFRELFDGNNDNNFITALKFTRKTIKFYSGFYNSDIILASPLGLRRIIENEDAKKRDHDFLSSIEVVIVDQTDAMQQQNWENVEIVFRNLNLDLKEAHGCDFSRVRSYYLDGQARFLRQTIIFSAYITPEMNSLFSNNMSNVTGKVKLAPIYPGAITETSGLGIKQTFSRFDARSPSDDPDSRFQYFTSAILPGLLRLPKPVDGAPGILIFIPTYYDFLRVRNYFATSTQTENISFGAIHDYSEVSEQRRARSHFLSGRYSFLLYTQRAHHFYRLKLRGVKRIALYGLPDNPLFYRELVDGFLGTSLTERRLDVVEVGARSAFSKWDGLRLERIVGSERVRTMLGGTGDTFDFL